MTLTRLSTRLAVLQVGWQAEVERRMDGMTDEQLAGLIGPGAIDYVRGLTDAQLLAQNDGSPEASQRFLRGYRRWRRTSGL